MEEQFTVLFINYQTKEGARQEMVEQKVLGVDKECGGEGAKQVGVDGASLAQSTPDNYNMKSPSRDIFGAEFNGTPSHQRQV